MRRRTAGPAAAMPLSWRHALLSEHTTVIGWLLSDRTLLRVGQPASGDPLADVLAAASALDRPGLLLAGVDLGLRPASGTHRVRVFADGGRMQPEHLMPRTQHADTLALWRPRPGSEPSLDTLAGG